MDFFTGVDIIRISRVEKSLENPDFSRRFFGLDELKIYNSRGCPPSFIAGNFAAKEAFSKALGTGVRGFALKEVQVLRDTLGHPYYHFSGKAKEIVDERRLTFDVSISHDGDYAVAFVVAYRKDD